METPIVAFVADAWHSNDSKQFFGIFSDMDSLIVEAKRYFRTQKKSSRGGESFPKFNEEDQNNLYDFSQTQGYDWNLMVEKPRLNIPQL